MPTHHDETLLERYQREHREFERISMSKHTPGPWTSYTGTNSIWAEGKRAICIVTGARNHEDKERDANATLIAAAPDLLEALKAARDHIDMEALRISHCNDAEQIGAAIAKAQGEQP